MFYDHYYFYSLSFDVDSKCIKDGSNINGKDYSNKSSYIKNMALRAASRASLCFFNDDKTTQIFKNISAMFQRF